MSHTVTEDWTTLPEALLPVVKQHCRVDFDDDDAILTRYIQWAISYCQGFTGLQIFEAEVVWTPALDGAARYPCPVQPVSAFGVMAETVDVSADYALQSGALTAPVWLVHSDGTAFATDAEVTLTTGYADADQIPPALYGNILRIAATMYENRESISAISLDQVPSWMNDMITGLWVPRA
jgi:uncharacterized phiE125 gp8 family phage protein